MTIYGSAKKVLKSFEAEGIHGPLQYVGKRLVRTETYNIFEGNVDVIASNPKFDNDLNVRLLENKYEDIDILLHFWKKEYPEIYNGIEVKKSPHRFLKEKIDAGHICFLSETDGEILLFHWYAPLDKESFSHERILKHMDFRPLHAALYYHACCATHMRGRGMATRQLQIAASVLKQRGFRKLYAAIMPSNTASLKVWRKVGAKHIRNIQLTRYIMFDVARIEKVLVVDT